MTIKSPLILSAEGAETLAARQPFDFDAVVSIWGRIPINYFPLVRTDINFPIEKVLKIRFDDITDLGWNYQQGIVPPTPEIVSEILTFVKGIPPERILFHCAAGLSRSPASALLAMLQYHGVDKGIECVDALFKAKPDVVPNPLIMRYGEKLLGMSAEKAIPMNKHIAIKAGVGGLYI